MPASDVVITNISLGSRQNSYRYCFRQQRRTCTRRFGIDKGTTIGTQTDAAGAFSLNVPASATALTVSYVGFAAQEINIQGQTAVTVTLSGENQQTLMKLWLLVMVQPGRKMLPAL
jgi:hypothetical protein